MILLANEIAHLHATPAPSFYPLFDHTPPFSLCRSLFSLYSFFSSPVLLPFSLLRLVLSPTIAANTELSIQSLRLEQDREIELKRTQAKIEAMKLRKQSREAATRSRNSKLDLKQVSFSVFGLCVLFTCVSEPSISLGTKD